MLSSINQQEKFVSFDQLEPFQPYFNYVQLLREASNGVINSSTEQEQLSVIYLLRRMRKYQRALFDVTFDNILSRFVSKFLIKGDKMSTVFYQSLFFVNEIFSEYNFDFNDSWLEQLYPPVEEFVFNSNEQITQLAKMVIRSFAINMKYNTTIEILFSSLFEGYENESKVNFVKEMLELFFNTIDKINLAYGFDWNEIIHYLPQGNENNRHAIQHIFLLLNRLLENQWEEFMSSLNGPNQKLVNKIMNMSFIQ